MAAPAYAGPSDTELDASFYYWDMLPLFDPSTYSVWRAPRAGGRAEKLADLPPRDAPSSPQLTVTADSLLVAISGQNVAYAVPLAGGSPRTLPPPPVASGLSGTFLVGSSPAGVLWANGHWDDGLSYPTTKLLFSPVAGSSTTTARPFWSSKPPFLRPAAAWGDGAGGWLIAGEETLADGSRHSSVWAVDAAGTVGTRLGCNPKADRGSVSSTVSTADAVYAVVTHFEREPDGFQAVVVRIDRTPSAPFGG